MSKDKQELVTQEKKELQNKMEHIIQGKKYTPATDIVETKSELVVNMNMPGVKKTDISIKLENNVLTVDGKIDPSPYLGLTPLYSEYNVGHFTRAFEISNAIDQSKINARMDNGVLTLSLPKTPEKQARLIKLS